MGVGPRDFTGTEFAAGEVYGERSWDYWSGALHSPAYSHRWTTEGENVSTCQRHYFDYPRLTMSLVAAGKIPEGAIVWKWDVETVVTERFEVIHYMVADWVGTRRIAQNQRSWFRRNSDTSWLLEDISGRAVLPMVDVQQIVTEYGPPPPAPCDYADCHCGYYGFTNGFNEYAAGLGRVTGIIKGYGETVIGDRGFRAKKARIVALAVPDRTLRLDLMMSSLPRGTQHDVYRRVLTEYRHPDWMRILTDAFPTVPVFANAELMRLEFPPTDLTQYLKKDKEESA